MWEGILPQLQGDVLKCLDILPVTTGVRCCWHLVSGRQGQMPVLQCTGWPSMTKNYLFRCQHRCCWDALSYAGISHLMVHEHHLEGCLKHKFLDPTPTVSDTSVCLEQDPKVCVSDKFPSDDDTTCLGTTLWEPMLYSLFLLYCPSSILSRSLQIALQKKKSIKFQINSWDIKETQPAHDTVEKDCYSVSNSLMVR